VKASVSKIISGGQTGADRAALDFAIEHGIPCGGWCPKGRRSEDGPIPAKYKLEETPSRDYPQRTEWNVRDSDGTAIFSIAPVLTGGSLKTIRLAERHEKPVVHISRERDSEKAAEKLASFIGGKKIRVLNVAGPRASKEPDVEAFVEWVLSRALRTESDVGSVSVA
jgi:hypothetical protein